jgi:hypothetical protein
VAHIDAHTACRARGVTQMGTGDGWPVDGNLSTGHVHGSWCSGMARSRARARAEELGQQRSGGSLVW